MRIPLKVKEHVTWKELLFIMASFSAFWVIGLVRTVALAEDKVSAGVQVMRETVTTLERKVDSNKATADAGMQAVKQEIQEVRKDTQAVYQYLLTKQRQPRLESP